MVKKIIYKTFLIALFVLFILPVAFSQHRMFRPTDEDTLIGNRVYRPYANYVLISYGVGFNFRQHMSEQAGAVMYTLRIKKIPVRIGYSVVSKYFVMSRSLEKINDLVLLTGKRIETNFANFSFFAGLSYSYGTYYFYHDPGSDLNVYRAFTKPGLYMELELTKKIFFDIGFGASLFGTFNGGYSEYYSTVNPFYGAVGMRFNLYFSGAYRGEIKY